jgi:hypothetical protein
MTSNRPILKTTRSNVFRLRERAGDEQGVAGFRREVKFALPIADLGKLRTILDVNCRRTVFNQSLSRVTSVYFDDGALSACFESLEGVERRAKVRLRWYDGHDGRFFFEIKRRAGDVIQKRRLAVQSSVPLSSLTYREISKELGNTLPPEDGEVLLARPDPMVSVIYDREHFQTPGASIRITLDSNIRCYDQSGVRRVSERFGVTVPGHVVIEGKAPPGEEIGLPQMLHPLRPVLTKSSKYVLACRKLGHLPGAGDDPY